MPSPFPPIADYAFLSNCHTGAQTRKSNASRSGLLAATFDFLPADDERLRNNVLAIESELTEGGFVLRYRTEETDDGLSGRGARC